MPELLSPHWSPHLSIPPETGACALETLRTPHLSELSWPGTGVGRAANGGGHSGCERRHAFPCQEIVSLILTIALDTSSLRVGTSAGELMYG